MNTMKRTNAGDCYEVAGRFALDRATVSRNDENVSLPAFYVV